MYRETWAEISLKNLLWNLEEIRKAISFPKVDIIAVVKANAYGHGAIPITLFLSQNGNIKRFAVATPEEAIELLSKEGIYQNVKEILIFGPVYKKTLEEIDPKFLQKITFIITDFGIWEELEGFVKAGKGVLRTHLQVDTGMGRLGIWWEEKMKIYEKLSDTKLRISGIMSHFPVADTDLEFSRNQIKIFSEISRDVEKILGYRVDKHIANSAGIFNLSESHFDVVRPGLSLYGSEPTSIYAHYKPTLKNVMSLKTKIAIIKKMKKGSSISYGRTYILPKDKPIGILCVGYADGISTLHSNKGYVLVKGKKAPIVGRVTMDYIMIDLDGIEAEVGDEVLIFGEDEKLGTIKIEEFARWGNVIPYEVTCAIGKRVPRIYIYD